MRILNSCVVLQDSILQTGVCARRSSHTLSMLDGSHSTRHQRSIILQLWIARTQWWVCFTPCCNMQIHSVVFALLRQIHKQKVCENSLICASNKVFVKYQAQEGHLKAPLFLYAFEKSVDCHLLSCFAMIQTCTISIQVCTFHDVCKQGIDQQIFNRKSISRKIMQGGVKPRKGVNPNPPLRTPLRTPLLNINYRLSKLAYRRKIQSTLRHSSS